MTGKWHDIPAGEAKGIDCRQRPDLEPPLNEEGEPCPWPWEPEQLTGIPLGQYHCPYCGAMAVAGLRHPDYRNMPDEWKEKPGERQ